VESLIFTPLLPPKSPNLLAILGGTSLAKLIGEGLAVRRESSTGIRASGTDSSNSFRSANESLCPGLVHSTRRNSPRVGKIRRIFAISTALRPIWDQISLVFSMDSELKAIVRASDEARNGSEWVQYFCHPTDLYKSFVKFYYAHVATEEYGISWKLSEMMRHMVAHLCATQGRGA
jgi:hypothetical protein